MMELETTLDESLAQVALPAGTSLSGDQFTIIERISAGGFGITYRAKDNILGRTIVIKECFADDFCLRSGKSVIARNQAYEKHFRSTVTMFMREARSLAKLRHQNIVGVHRAFEENETAYMVLDLINGFDLHNIMQANNAPLPPDGVKDMLLQLLDAIETIHMADLLHRDISPDNVMIETDGNPVLIDFGAARGDASRRTRAMSAMLVVKDGYSPQEFYMAGSLQTPCSDLYGLAATFYHILSGKPPPNSQIRMMEIAAKNPDPCVPLVGRIDGYAPSFLRAIDMAMQSLPKDRLQSAEDWRDMILQGENEAPTVAPKTVPVATVAEAAPAPLELKRTLTKLVEETNAEVHKTQLKVVETAPAKAPEPEKSVSPEWVEQFNRDTLARELAGDGENITSEAQVDPSIESELLDDGSGAAPTAGPAQTAAATPPDAADCAETDWIGRAHEKQERTRALLLAESEQQGTFRQALSKADPTPAPDYNSAPILTDEGEGAPQPQPQMSVVKALLIYLGAGIGLGLVAVIGYLAIML